MKPASEIAVDIVCFSLECDDKKRQEYYRLLSDDEKLRAARFHFDRHRNRFINGRGAIRQILGERGNCRPQSIRFELNEYGKPAFGEPESARNIHFNASSSDKLGAIAIANCGPLGLDIEKIKRDGRQDYDGILNNEFTADEIDCYTALDEADRLRYFFELWTCKEAYLKALGIGLSGQLDSFSIDLQGRNPVVSATRLEAGGRSKLLLHRIRLADQFVACLALPGQAVEIKLRNW